MSRYGNHLKMKVRSIRMPSDVGFSDPLFKGSKQVSRQIRYAPAGFFSPGHVIIYGDQAAIITTAKENFGAVITSQDYTTIMRSWFKELWKVSREKS